MSEKQELPRWIFVAKRGHVGTVRAADAQAAWQKASKRYKVGVLVSMNGEGYVESTAGGCLREKDADWEPEGVAKVLQQIG